MRFLFYNGLSLNYIPDYENHPLLIRLFSLRTSSETSGSNDLSAGQVPVIGRKEWHSEIAWMFLEVMLALSAKGAHQHSLNFDDGRLA